ncbi:MAG: protein kinase [Acidobacteria bacterium]|nr:protein kinase [Acidobacteriota bacterium]
MILTPGTRLGPYEILALLGAGAMGDVYRARDTRLGRAVALKILRFPEAVERFAVEARAAGLLNHPNILAIYDIGVHDECPYLVSELLEGETLRERLLRGTLPPVKALDFAAQIASGLAAAHGKGIVHRDLKPSNLFVTEDGRIKILDFGLAKHTDVAEELDDAAEAATSASLTDPGHVVGTAGYMSPEQIRGAAVDHRSDVFALGVILYEMLTGRRAFHRESAVETLHATLKEDPPPPPQPLPPGVDALLRDCLEKSPDERFQSARDVVLCIRAVTSGLSSGARALTAAAPAPGRRPWRLALAGGALGAAVVGLAFATRTPAGGPPTYHQLTFRRGSVLSARFAPDGRTIVYGAAWEGQPSRIYSARPESPESRDLELPDGDILAISPTGEMALSLGRRFVAGWATRGILARAPLAGGAPRELLANVEAADWSPDGRLVIVRAAEGRYRLEFPVGTILHETEGWMSHARISPEGTRIAFVDHPVYGDDRGSVCVIGPDGRRVVLADGWSSVSGLAWSPRGDEVWFTAAEVGATCSLRAVDLTGRRRLVATVPGRMAIADVHRDGRVLLADGRFRLRLALADQRSGGEKDLSWLDGSLLTDLSDDGRTVLFDEEVGGAASGAYSIYMRRTDGSPAIRLGDGTLAALSPDGRWVAVVVQSRTPGLVLVPTGPGEARTLDRGAIAYYEGVAWFPDGAQVLFAGSEEGRSLRLYVQGVAGGPPRPVSPEGLRIAYATRPVSPDGQAAVAVDGAGRALLVPLNGGKPRPVPGLEPNDIPFRWGGDGRSLFLFRTGEMPARAQRLELASGRRDTIAEIAPFDRAGVRSLTTIQATPDGRRFAYTYSQSLSELYLVEGLR